MHAIWRSRGMPRGTQIDRWCVREFVAAENIDRRVVRLDQRVVRLDQAVLTPVPGISAIDCLDRFLAANGSAAELRGRQFLASYNTPGSVGFGCLFRINKINVF